MTNFDNMTQPNWRPRVSDWVLFGVLLLLTLLDGFVYIMYERHFYNIVYETSNYYSSSYESLIISVWTILSYSVTILFYVLLLIALFKMKRNAHMVGKKNASALFKVSFVLMLIVAILSILSKVFYTTSLPTKLMPEIISYDTFATLSKVYYIICSLLSITGILLLSIGITKTNAKILKRIAWIYFGLIVANFIWEFFSLEIIRSTMEYRLLIIPVISTIITLVLNTLVGLLFVYRRETIKAKDEEEMPQQLAE